MQINFTKMHGLGNDFIVFNAIQQPIHLTTEQLRFIADRHFGIGCDQILFVESSTRVDFRYRIFNADGNEVQQCGNGARCFARFVHDNRLTDKNCITVETQGGDITLFIQEDGNVRVNMGAPCFTPAQIPFHATHTAKQYQIIIDTETYHIGVVSMGNPHAVFMVDDVNTAPVNSLGPQLMTHAFFPQQVNVGFMQIHDKKHIQLRVFERGVGETLACGTGACAAVVIGQRWGLLDTQVTVQLPGGKLQIEWEGNEQQPVWMIGAATHVFEGKITL